jgi:hypothetical protein
MASAADSLLTDLAAAHAMIIAQREALVVAEAKAAAAESVAKSRALEIEQLKYQIAKLKHEQYGQSSERSAVLEQLELKLSELEEDASSDWTPLLAGLSPAGMTTSLAARSPRFPGDPSRAFASSTSPNCGFVDAAPAPFTARASA